MKKLGVGGVGVISAHVCLHTFRTLVMRVYCYVGNLLMHMLLEYTHGLIV